MVARKKSPTHSNPTQPRRYKERPNGVEKHREVVACAPYNFVPLPTTVVAAQALMPHDRYDGESGWIDCELITRSPTYIRGMLEVGAWSEQKKKKETGAALEPDDKLTAAPFFSTEMGSAQQPGTPLIPGSSLRGMIRALVEITSYSKPSGIADSHLVYRAVGDRSSLGNLYREELLGPNKATGNNIHLAYPSPNLKGGYLRQRSDGGWEIQPATLHARESFVHVEYSDAQSIIGGKGRHCVHAVHVTPAPRMTSSRRAPGGRPTLNLDVAVTKSILEAKGTPTVGMVLATLVESGHMHGKHWHCAIYEPDPKATRLAIPDEMWQLYQEDSKQDHARKVRKLSADGDPLFYLLDNAGKLRFFGPTKMMRLPYPHTIHDYVPPDLLKTHPVDLTEALFGYVRSEKQPQEQALAGRVFVTDAQYEKDEGQLWYSDTPITPHVLGQPKPTTFQHYLVQDADEGHDPDEEKKLAHYGTPPEETQIRGHKLYWHKGAAPHIQASADERRHDNQLTRICPLRPGVHFRFKIHFENLRAEELGALLWALALPSDDNKTHYYHKLGMGKPLGMGAVEIIPTLHLINREERYVSLFVKDKEGKLRWAEVSREEPKRSNYISKFEASVFASLTAEEKGTATSLCEVKRIQMMLALLQWREGDEEWRDRTRYMEIEHELSRDDKFNEYLRRPVLADPLMVAASDLIAPRPAATGGSPATTPSTMPPPQKPATKTSANPLSRSPTSKTPPRLRGEDILAHINTNQPENEAKEARRRENKAEKRPKKKKKKR